ncbi:MAG: glycosyltransferase [Candidatus Magasanikbacteria bacterium]|nr:glycosyltransferase [Candidatus Magasanikbacteria bacterium]
MKVLHIIPSAFDYFGDIRAAAFSLVGKLPGLGVEADAFTLQYGSASREEQGEVAATAPSQRFVGLTSVAELIVALGEYDLIHVHCPFFGVAGKIIAWKREHPNIPLVATFHRRVATPDFFSLGIVWYNRYYLPKLFAVADAVAAPSIKIFQRSFGATVTSGKFYEVDSSTGWFGEELPDAPADPDDVVALKYALLYTSLLQNP